MNLAPLFLGAALALTPQPTLNVELLDKTLEFIRANKKRWDQGVWRYVSLGSRTPQKVAALKKAPECGTAMCFAGWAAQISGCTWAVSTQKLVAEALEENYQVEDTSILATPEERATGLGWYDDDRKAYLVSARDRAKRELGLTEAEANELFAGGNTLTDLRRIITCIKRGDYR